MTDDDDDDAATSRAKSQNLAATVANPRPAVTTVAAVALGGRDIPLSIRTRKLDMDRDQVRNAVLELALLTMGAFVTHLLWLNLATEPGRVRLWARLAKVYFVSLIPPLFRLIDAC